LSVENKGPAIRLPVPFFIFPPPQTKPSQPFLKRGFPACF